MNSPLDFLRVFRVRLREAGIRFALTSGMACVEYGLQQSTKDTDWIIAPEDLGKLRTLFADMEAASPGCRVMYRSLFGAPLDFEFLSHGWTSHLLVCSPDGAEHKVDIFGRAPRVRVEEIETDGNGLVARHIVAQMKKTDREKDWPFADSLGLQMWIHKDPMALLHIRHEESLQKAWEEAAPSERLRLIQRRPLLDHVGKEGASLSRLLLVERMIWQEVDRERYFVFKAVWKSFYRRWKKEEGWQWPVQAPFEEQHPLLLRAVHAHGLPPEPITADVRESVLAQALQKAITVANSSEAEVRKVLPPIEELLP